MDLITEELPKSSRSGASSSALEEWLAAVLKAKPAGAVRYPEQVSPSTVGDINADKKRNAKSADVVALGRNATATGEEADKGKTWLYVILTSTPEGKELAAKRAEFRANRKPRAKKATAAKKR